MKPLFRNDVFLLDQKRFRVLDSDRSGALYAFPLDDPRGLPVRWAQRNLELLEREKKLKIVSEPETQRPLVASEVALRLAERRWETIRDLVQLKCGELMDRKTRAKAIAQHCEIVRVSDRHVMALLRKLWRFGLNKTSLIGNYHNCGRISAETSGAVVVRVKPPTGDELVIFAPPTERARGRRPIHADYEPFSYPPKLKEILIRDIRNIYLRDETVSIRALQDEILAMHFCLMNSSGEPVRNNQNGVKLRPLGMRPSNEQIRYLVKKAVPEHEAYAKRVSADSFRNDIARSDGSVHDDCVGPGDVYEIDATILDVWLVSSYHSGVIIGKPTFYLIIDRASDLIVGFYLSLNKPSWEGAKRAILSISSDWEALCKAMGVKYRESDWPAHRVYPNRFFTDRGEGVSEKSDVVTLGPQIEVTTSPRASPRRKCRVEGGFHTIHVTIKDNIGGYEPPKNVKKRLGKKYSKDARYTLDEIGSVILRAIIKHNNSVRERAVLHPKLIYEGFHATPIAIWNHNIAHSMGRASRHDFEHMRVRLLPIGTGKATQAGIEFQKLLYSFESPRFGVLCALAARGAKIEIQIQYDPARVGEIWVSEKSAPSVLHRATLITRFERLSEVSFAEAMHFLKATGVAARRGRLANQELRIGFSMDTESHERELSSRVKEAAQGVPFQTRVRVGVEARKFEEQQREMKHLTNQTAESVAIQGLTPLAISEQKSPDTGSFEDLDASSAPPRGVDPPPQPRSSQPVQDIPPPAPVAPIPSPDRLTDLLGLLDDDFTIEH